MLDKGVENWIDKNIKNIINKSKISDISDKEVKLIDLLISIKIKNGLREEKNIREDIRVIEELIFFIAQNHKEELIRFKHIFVKFLESTSEEKTQK